MNTKIINIDKDNIDGEALKEAGQIIRDGGLVAFPTETVYGLGANALDAQAAMKVYAAKGRPSDNPLIAHICDIEMLKPLVKKIPPVAEKLMDAFWPGPLTLIFEKSDIVPKGTTGGLDTVAIRFPNHPIASRLIKEAGTSIAAPSANLSGKPSPTLGEHVIDDLDGRIDMIIDAANQPLSEAFLKSLHRTLKSGTSDSRKEWFAVGEYKKLPNEVGGMEKSEAKRS